MDVENRHKVNKKQWNRWSPSQRLRFNHVFEMMFNNQDLFHHPKAVFLNDKHWKTVCWNAAWISNDV